LVQKFKGIFSMPYCTSNL